MNDSSLYLNYPGLKYLNNMESDWDEDSSYYMGYEGLKYLSKKQSNLNNKEKKFLNLDGLQYMLFARMFSVLEDYKRKEDEKEYADDSSIRIEYDEDGGINLICDTNNKSLYIDSNGECGSIDRKGMLMLMVVKDAGITGRYYINSNGEIVKNG